MPEDNKNLFGKPTSKDVKKAVEIHTENLMQKGLSEEDAKEIAEYVVESNRDRIVQALGRLEETEVARTDALTGLNNRRVFNETMVKEVERAERLGESMGMILIDLDKFKLINDTMNYEVGDAALKIVAQIIKKSKRNYDTATRYGGEEFAVIMPGVNALEASKFGTRIKNAIENNLKSQLLIEFPEFKDQISKILGTASFGVSSFTGTQGKSEPMRPQTIINLSNSLLHGSKELGRNQLNFSDVSHAYTNEEVEESFKNSSRSEYDEIHAAAIRSQKLYKQFSAQIAS